MRKTIIAGAIAAIVIPAAAPALADPPPWAPAHGRRAKFYTVTRPGLRRLQQETADWHRLSAAISLLGGIIFREAEPYPPPRLATTLPLLVFYWATGIMTALFFAAWFLETHYIFSPKVHW